MIRRHGSGTEIYSGLIGPDLMNPKPPSFHEEDQS